MSGFYTGSSTTLEDGHRPHPNISAEEKGELPRDGQISSKTMEEGPISIEEEERTHNTKDEHDASSISKTLSNAVPPPPSSVFPPGLHPDDFPDGGLTAWLVVLGGAMCLFCSFGLVNCAGVFVEYYYNGPLSEYSSSTITWITSLQTFVITGTNVVTGRLFDSYGPRLMLPIGTLLLTLGLMFISLSKEYYQFILSQGILAGIGAACVYNCAANSTLTWFYRKRATALGIVVAGSSLGGTVLPIFLSKLIVRIGFPWTVRALGFIVLALCGTACLLVKSRINPTPRPFELWAYITPFKEARFTIVVAASFFVFWGMYLPFNYINIQAQQLGVDANLIPYLLSIISAVSIVGRIVPGIIGDYIGKFNTIIIIALLSGTISLAIWIPATSTGPLIAYLAIYGFTSGGYISLIPAVMAQISDLREIGTRSGVSLLVGSLGALTGAPIGGAILSAQGGKYTGLQLFTGISILVGSVLLILARFVQVGLKPVKI
ncbi:monocarboxylate permease-like protein [Xylariaceae sp. FL1272]|nr:monocarboxylate permease-like protein [Xylariaceae sp. FL1272]